MIVGFGQSIMTVSDNYAVTLKNFMLPMRCMTTNDGAGRELASYATIGEKVQQQGAHLQSKVQHDPSWQLPCYLQF